MASALDEARYGRLCLLTLNRCPARLRGVIDNYYRSSGIPDFETFLNNKLHQMFHNSFKTCCCGNSSNVTPLTRSQWSKLYTYNRVWTQNPHGRECWCMYEAITGIKSDVLDITYCCFFLTSVCSGISQADVRTIREERNKLIHSSSCTVDEPNFNATWAKVEFALLNLSKLVSPAFEADTKCILQKLKDSVIDPAELEALKQIMADNRDYDGLKQDVMELQDYKHANEGKNEERDRNIEMLLTSKIEGAENTMFIEDLPTAQMELMRQYQELTKSVDVLPFADSTGIPIADIFSPLLMEEDLKTKERLPNPKDPDHKQIKSMKELFYIDNKPPKRIFMKGEAGCGKTLFCYKLLDSWCKTKQPEAVVIEKKPAGCGGRLSCLNVFTTFREANNSDAVTQDELQQCLSDFDLVFYIPLRNTSGNLTSVQEMISGTLSINCQKLLINNQTHCLVILDGLDEWPCPGFKELPGMHGIANYVLFCTTRPWKFTQLNLKFSQEDKIAKILGLLPSSEDKVIEYVLKNYYKLKPSDLKKTFKKYSALAKCSNLKSLLTMPMMLTACCCMWYEEDVYSGNSGRKETPTSPLSMTYTYLSLVYAMIRRADEKWAKEKCDLRSLLTHIDPSSKPIPKILSDFKHISVVDNTNPDVDIITALLPFCRKAYSSLVSEETQLVFQKEQLEGEIGRAAYADLVSDDTKLKYLKYQIERDIGTSLVQLALKIGLISQAKAPGRFHHQNVSVNFYHKTVQEFMSAVHLVCTRLDDFRIVCSCSEKVMEMANIINFVMGLDPVLGSMLSEHISSIEDSNLVNYRETLIDEYEGKLEDLYKTQLQWYREAMFNLSETGTTPPSPIIHIKDIFMYPYSDEDTVRMSEELMVGCKENILSVTLMSVPYSLIKVLGFLPQCTNLKALAFTHSEDKENNDKFLSVLPQLKTLDNFMYYGRFAYSPEYDAMYTAVVGVVLTLKQLKLIGLWQVNLGDDGLALSGEMTKLEKVRLVFAYMSDTSWDNFITSLLSIRRTIQVELQSTNIDDDTLDKIKTSPHIKIIKGGKRDQYSGRYENLEFKTVLSE